jgi:hypothetical protein
MMRFNYETNMWGSDNNGSAQVYQWLGYNSPMETGHGYFAWALDSRYNANNADPYYDVTNRFDAIMEGRKGKLFNDNSLTVTLNNTASYLKTIEEPDLPALWYALSNPYPANIYTNKFAAGNTYDGSTPYSANDIFTLKLITVNQTHANAWETLPVEKIKHGEGFFVALRGGNGDQGGSEVYSPFSNRTQTFIFNKGMLVKTAKSLSEKMSDAMIRIDVDANGVSQDSYIIIDESASNGFDVKDRFRMHAANTLYCEPEFVVDSIVLGVNSVSVLPYECPMNITSHGDNLITLRVSGIPDDVTFYLIDNGTEYEMNNGDVYNTTLSDGKNAGRFVVRLNKFVGLDAARENVIDLWVAKNILNVQGENLRHVVVYNSLGQKVYDRAISGTSFSDELNLAAGAYTAKATAKSGSKTIKFVITK